MVRMRLAWAVFLPGIFFYGGSPRSQLVAQSAPPSSSSTPAAQSPAETNSAELNSHDEPTSFKVNVKLVLVRVVARDNQGRATGTLKKDDFQVFDNRKPQVITQFSVEQPGTQVATAKADQEKRNLEPGAAAVEQVHAPTLPERFVAYVFDDVHAQFSDLAYARKAADKNLASLQPSDRVAIFTTSGQNNLDFTDDRTQLRQALLRLQPRPVAGSDPSNCPNVPHYMADLIQNQQDSQALLVATQDALHCEFDDNPKFYPQAQATAIGAAAQALVQGDAESRLALGVLKDVVRRVANSPGQRTIILVSPGFLTPRMETEYSDLIDHALRSQIIINTLDARGLYTIDPVGDISAPTSGNPFVNANKLQYQMLSASADDDILAVLADSTGGIFFHNNNDLDEGFRRLSVAPEYYYVLGFSPQNLKLDGSFHSLKVTLKNPQKKLTLQARRGYFAPKNALDPNEQAAQEIEDAMYSQEELHNLPVNLRTQFFKASDENAKLVVVAHVDVKRLRFRKVEGRNDNVLTCVSVLFNSNGRFIDGTKKTVTMHWKDETLAHKLDSGMTLKTSFDVKPGSYLVRLVVRDAEGQLMSAENGTVEIR